MDLAVLALAPVVQGFKILIEEDGAVYTAFDEMFRQAAAAEAAVAAEAAAEVAATAAAAVEAARAADEQGAEAAALAAKAAAAAVRSAAAAGTVQAARQAEATANAQVLAAADGVVEAQVLGEAATAAAVEAAAATAAVAAAAKAAAAVAKAEAQVEDYVELMLVINTLLLTPPRYGLGPSVMASSVPFYAVISRFCNTHAGYEAFTNPRVNANLCGVFAAWRTFLESPGSRVVLGNGPGGWFSDDALRAMVESAGGGPDQTFQDFYVCIPDAAHYNFTSYDDFFTRELRPEQVIPPDGDSSIVRSACSSTVHSFYTGLRKTERFCIKNTPYSLRHILAGDDAVDTFVGGTLLQAMLGCTDYHRWHSPVNGTVVRTRLISGTSDPPPVPHPTYFAGLLDGEHKDPDVITRSQDFVTAISTRALIFIEAQEPIGLMCFVAVGLCEVSTCDITVSEGDPLVKGTPLGTFRFGGSTHCLIFRRGLNVTPINPNLVKSKVQVGQNILNVAAQV